jgi:uncharacterized protein (DUF1810 family)
VNDARRLERFTAAQDRNGTYERAVAELRSGRKKSHWMWYVFPQITGLGFSPAAQEYGISGLEEARAYLRHPVLGPRLRECARIVVDEGDADAALIFGFTDAMKLRSSMTLFAAADPDEPVFAEVLDQYFRGEPDDATLARL